MQTAFFRRFAPERTFVASGPGTPGPFFKARGRVGSILCLGVFLFINLLFALKYASRVGIGPWVSGPLFALCFGIQVAAAGALAVWAMRRKRAGAWLWILMGSYLVAAYAVYRTQDPYALDVDRWSALQAFFDALFRGDFPWDVRSHLGTRVSVFPVMQALALPFYLLGDVGLLQFAGIIAFAALLAARYRESGRPLFLIAIFLVMPAIQYQVFARSDLLGNAVAVAWVLHFGLKPGAADGGRLYAWAVVWGLALSTRAIFVIPFIYASWRLIDGRGVRAAAVYGLVAAGAFAATFAPFYLWDPTLFWIRNPYFVQSGYATRGEVAAVLAATIAAGFLRRRAAPSAAFALAGATLFLTILMCWAATSLRKGWGASLWASGFDITYFSLCLPFLVIALGDALPGRGEAGAESARP